MNEEARAVECNVKCRNKAKKVIAETIHEEATKEIQKSEEIRVEERMRHIYCMARVKTVQYVKGMLLKLCA